MKFDIDKFQMLFQVACEHSNPPCQECRIERFLSVPELREQAEAHGGVVSIEFED